jgi:hypothetical protein
MVVAAVRIAGDVRIVADSRHDLLLPRANVVDPLAMTPNGHLMVIDSGKVLCSRVTQRLMVLIPIWSDIRKLA